MGLLKTKGMKNKIYITDQKIVAHLLSQTAKINTYEPDEKKRIK